MSNNKKSGKEKSNFSYYELFNSVGGNNRAGVNKFVNDGSFLESFKKKQQEQTEEETSSTSSISENVSSPIISTSKPIDSNANISPNQLANSVTTESIKTDAVNDNVQTKKLPTLPLIGKRRGGKVLPTGLVKKAKKEDEEEPGEARTDAWSHYMAEVKRYQQQSCEDDRKTRPLVK